MRQAPLIAIAGTGYVVERPFGALPVQGAPQSYVEAVRSAGGVPAVVAPVVEEASYDWLDAVGGLVLTGGEDVGAAPERDRAEQGLLRAALERGIPVLGICRGAQLANVAHGGTLLPDLDSLGRQHVLPHGGHLIETVDGSVLHELLGTSVRVNSLHHQAVDRPGTRLSVTARAADGTVEAIEGPGLLGVQWHPELVRDDVSRALFGWLMLRARAAASR